MNYKRSILIAAMAAVCSAGSGAGVVWYDGSRAVSYQVEGTTAPVVSAALDMFASDMAMVTGQRAVAGKEATIHIYELDTNKAAADKLRQKGVPVDSLLGKNDAFYIAPLPAQGAGGSVLVVGSNGRGTAYAILELSRMAGVSPWVWWGDVVPERRDSLVLDEGQETLQSPSVEYRGIFINDEDWSLRNWAWKNFDKSSQPGRMGPKTYKALFQLMLRLRANTIWPAMHEGTTGFFTVAGNKETADSFGILIGTSHCEPLLRNNVAEWDHAKRGDYNYMTNRDEVKRYWAERLQQVKGSEELFTIGMRGIHDGSMEGVKTRQEKLDGLQQVIDDQRELLRKYYDKDVERVPQVFIPYKEVLEILESGLRVPDDVTLLWCDDNYGYMTRLADEEQQRRSGGGGVYSHLSYWGRPHDHLWLTTTQPGLIYNEMRAAYDHNCRRLWIANVHDPKVAAYDLELFLDMAWNINSVTPTTLADHLQRWLTTQFGPFVAKGIAPAMTELYRLNAIRKPEFMGWTQVELDKKRYPGGKSVPTTTEFTHTEAYQRMADFAHIEATVELYGRQVPQRLQEAYFAAVLYPVHASAAMTRKMLGDSLLSQQAYEEIASLTRRYNAMGQGKWDGIMSAEPRALPVFGKVSTTTTPDDDADSKNYIARNASDYQAASPGVQPVQMLGHSMSAVAIPKGSELTYQFETPHEGPAVLYTAMIPTQPSDKGDLRYSVQLDDQPAVVISLKEKYRSEFWKLSVLRGQALKQTPVDLTKGHHTLRIKAIDNHVIADQWMLDFNPGRKFYVIPVGH